MKIFLKIVIISVILFPFFSNNSNAQPTQVQIDELKQQILEIQRQNQQQIEMLQKKIESLETERASDELKIEEYIAKKEAKDDDAWWKKLKAGYKKGLFFQSTDGNYKMKVTLRGQVQFALTNTDDEETGRDTTDTRFDIRRARIKFNGNAFRPWFLYTMQLAADSADVQLRDLYFDAAYNPQIVPRVGQWKIPFNREELNSSSALQFVARSILTPEFGMGRSTGAAVGGAIANHLTYSAGLFTGCGRNNRNCDGTSSNIMYAGRIQFGWGGNLKYSGGSYPSGGDYKLVPNFGKTSSPIIVIGAGLWGQRLDIDAGRFPDGLVDDRIKNIGMDEAFVNEFAIDFNLKNNFFNIEAGYIGRWIDPEGSVNEDIAGTSSSLYDQGFRVQGGVFVVPKTVEIVGRYAWFELDEAGEDNRDSVWQITPGVNYYISHDHRWKIQLSYSYIVRKFLDKNDIVNNNFLAQLQAYF